MPWTKEDQIKLNSERFKSGKVKRVAIDLIASDYEKWQLYANDIGMKYATMIRNCVMRCMLEDGYISQDDITNNYESEKAQEHNSSKTIEKRKPGRPRKNPIEADTIEKPKRGRGRPRKNNLIENN